MSKYFSTLLCLFLFAAFSVPVFAMYQPPAFPVCTSPQGNVIAQYAEGSHAIAGQDGLQNGSDTVYAIDTNLNQVMQCFCPPTEMNGVQTNWLQANNLSDVEKQELKNNGWIEENGSAWGLANAPYFAKNTSYVCHGSAQQATPNSPITAVVQSANATAPSSSNSTNGSSPSSGSGSNNTPSSSNSSFPSLPNTGDSIVVLQTLAGGILLFSLSFFLKKVAE
jgi:LPXTG-motif cell wall-anchored protein